MDKVWVLGVALLSLGFACGVVSIAIDYWYYQNVTTAKGERNEIFFGLWKFCAYNNSKKSSVCRSWDNKGKEFDTSWLHACQAFMIVGGIDNALTLGLAIFSIWLKATIPRTKWIGLGLFGSTCYVTTVFIFGSKHVEISETNLTGGHLHAGFGLAIVAGILNVISTVLVGNRQETDGYENISSSRVSNTNGVQVDD